jgi:ferritin-like metal-binding protein YciE
MRIETMQDFFLEQIRDLYDCEQRLAKALPKMAQAATAPELRTAIEEHLQQTLGQIRRLEQVFTEIGEEAKGQTCEGIKGLIEEGEEIMDDIKQSYLRDAGIIAAGNRIEHYEMAAYGTARSIARTLDMTRSVDLLQQTLEEEKQADAKLTMIAENTVNPQALRTGVRTAR